MKKLIIALSALYCFANACSSAPEVTGNIDIYEDFQSKFIASRSVRVWTPSDYDPQKKYDVIYMHDGQNLFDSSITWNSQEWGVDETLTRLMAEDRIRPCIVVGMDCGSLRYEEYYPSKICQDIPEGCLPEGFTPLGDEYLRFIVEEVKPFIDGKYSTWGDAAHTFVSGSSCGGLISSYALCEYPEVFSGAAGYDRTQEKINEMIYMLEWPAADGREGYMYRFFPGHAHTEKDWNSRFEIPILYLLAL